MSNLDTPLRSVSATSPYPNSANYLRETSLTRKVLLIRKWSSIYPHRVKSPRNQSIHKGHDVVGREGLAIQRWYTGIYHQSCPSSCIKVKAEGTVTCMMGLSVNRDDPSKKYSMGKRLSYSAGIVYSCGSPPGGRKTKKSHIGVSPRTRRELPWSSVADGNCAPLNRPQGPYRDCRGRVERALWQDAETDAGAVTSGALFIEFTRGFIL